MADIGDIVIYRNRDGVDIPAIVTGYGQDKDLVFLTRFAPSGASHDANTVSYPVEHGSGPGSWRERGVPDDTGA